MPIAIWNDGSVECRTLSPRDFGVDDLDPAGLAGGDAAFNASILRKVLAGNQVGHGERYEAALRASAMTAALGLELLEPGALDLDRLPDQLVRAQTVAIDGAARLVLHKWAEASTASADADLSYLSGLRPEEYRGAHDLEAHHRPRGRSG